VAAAREGACGDVKASGFGKEHGYEALDYYTETKSVVFGDQA